MADCSVAGVSIVKGKLLVKRRGTWTAYLDEIAGVTPPAVGSVVTLSWLGTGCTGTVLRSGAADTTVDAMIVGGRSDHSTVLPAAMYDYQLPVSMVLSAIVKDAGEQQSATIAPALLSRTLPRYVRRAGELGAQLDQLADTLGATWRVLLDGSVWLGIDSWTAAAPFDHVLSEGWAPSSGAVPILPEALGVLPGQLYTGPGGGGPAVNIYCGDVLYCITPDASTATIYAISQAAALALSLNDGRLSQALRSVIREELAPSFWRQTFGGRVIQQRPDGSLDVQLDNSDVPPLTSVDYRVLPAGAKLTIRTDARCDVVFEDADPARPIALLYRRGAGGHPAARQDDPVGWLLITAAVVAGVPVVVQSGWTATNPGLTPPPVPLTAGSYAQPLHITGGSPDLSLP